MTASTYSSGLTVFGRRVLLLAAFAFLVQAIRPSNGEMQAPRATSTFNVRDLVDKHIVGMKRQSDEAYNTSSSVLPTGVSTVNGQPPPTSSSTPHDPLLAIMPDFAFSMPAQIVVDGVNLALTTMLTIQLIFTMQYHFPLSKKNYLLQSCSTVLLLISLAVHLHTVLSTLEHQVHGWPYMFAYIAVQIPPQDGSWTMVQEGFYLLMRALSTLSIHLTHIQFLTLLFPSALEARLILWMLGPLALAASGMEFTALSSDDDVKTSDLGDAIRNICNSTLFLLYTSGLLIWGLMVNRRRAWRTDGGTAAFGGGSVGLAFINTMVSFVEIAFDRLWWLPDILWTLTLWQSWLGFWWWVGSGMGIGEVEDRAERQERRRKREEKLRRKRERIEKQQRKAAAAALAGRSSGSGTGGSQAAAVAASVENGSEAIMGSIRRFRSKLTGNGAEGRLSNRARSGTGNPDSATGADEAIELTGVPKEAREEPLRAISVDAGRGEAIEGEDVRRRSGQHHPDDVQTAAGSGSQSSDTNPTTSGAATSSSGWLGSMADYIAAHQPDFIRRRMRRLRLAHVAAARRAATEQTMLRDQVLNRQSEPTGPGLRTMMFDTNRSSSQSPLSPSLGLSTREPFSHRTGLAREATLTTTDSTGASSGRRAVMPILLEMDRGRRPSGSVDGVNSVHSLSVLPDQTSGSPTVSAGFGGAEDWRRRHSLHGVGQSADQERAGLSMSRRQGTSQTRSPHFGPTHEGEWIDAEDEDDDDEDDEDEDDDDEDQDEGPAGTQHGRQSRRHADAVGEDDTSSNVARDGDADELSQSAERQTTNSSNSWAWRGGLRSMRMRDHTTYD